MPDDVIKEALEQFETSQDGSAFNREAYYDDIKFARMGLQWPDDIAEQRKQEGKPCLTINKLKPLIFSVVNEARQNKPAIKVSPVDSGADEDTAEIIGGLIRNIERQSNAATAYDTAIDCAVSGGFGFFRAEIDYAHDETFELEARIRRIPNPLSVHWDTSSAAFDASDWDFCFVSDMLSDDEYKARYPKASMVPFDGGPHGDNAELWMDDDRIRVAEWFQRVKKQTKLLQIAIPNPQTGENDLKSVREDDLPVAAKRFFEAGMISTEGMKEKDMIDGFLAVSGVQIMRERMVDGYDVKRRIINGMEILEEDLWPGQSIPICPVWGEEVFLDGKRHFRSMIRDAKDVQMMFNFWRSASTEMVALAPKAPWVGPQGFVPKGHEAKWASANTRNIAYLEYAGNVPPSRTPPAGVPSGIVQEATMAAQDMQDITGIFNSAIGKRSNETSGKAIMARERQGDVANFHLVDNLNKAIAYMGKVLVEIIPAVYSPKETIRILGEDQTAKVIKLTQEDGGANQEGVNGQDRLYNLSIGKYDVDVKTGPSFATQREETRETLIEIMRQVPDAAAFVGDVLLDHMDFVGADKVAKRLKALLPPEVRKAEEEAENGQDPEKAALMQQNQALQQQMQQAQQAVMQEIERIKAENEALKRSNQADMARVQLDGQKAQSDAAFKEKELALKARELSLKEAEAIANAQPEDQAAQWAYESAKELERMAFDAAEAEKNRQFELTKMAMQQQHEMNMAEKAADEAEELATEYVPGGMGNNGGESPMMEAGD